MASFKEDGVLLTSNETGMSVLCEIVQQLGDTLYYTRITDNEDTSDQIYKYQFWALGFDAFGAGNTLVEAMEDAAVALLQKIQAKYSREEEEKVQNASPSSGFKGECFINKLAEICVVNKIPMPVYELISEPSTENENICTIKCKLSSCTEVAVGQTQFQAQDIAAKKMVDRVKDILGANFVPAQSQQVNLDNRNEPSCLNRTEGGTFSVDMTVPLADAHNMFFSKRKESNIPKEFFKMCQKPLNYYYQLEYPLEFLENMLWKLNGTFTTTVVSKPYMQESHKSCSSQHDTDFNNAPIEALDIIDGQSVDLLKEENNTSLLEEDYGLANLFDGYLNQSILEIDQYDELTIVNEESNSSSSETINTTEECDGSNGENDACEIGLFLNVTCNLGHFTFITIGPSVEVAEKKAAHDALEFLWIMSLPKDSTGPDDPLNFLCELPSRSSSPELGGAESPDLEFVYADADSYTNEIAELYSYTEQPEFQLNVKAFEDQMEMYGLRPCWQQQSAEQKRSMIAKLLDQLEVSNKVLRMKAARCFLYLAQGCWAEMQSDKEQQACAKDNVFILYQCGVFHAFVELLNIEIDNSATASSAMHKLAVSLADSTDLRVVLSVLYIIAEVIRTADPDEPEWLRLQEAFRHDISHPIGEELIVVKLFSMVTRFCSGSAPHFPMKKVLLLLWKMVLISLGGINTLRELKCQYRQAAGLTVLEEDTIEVVRNMRASSPPASAADLLEAQIQNQKRNNRPLRRSLMKQSSLDESLAMDFEQSDEEMRELEEQQAMDEAGEMPQPPSPRPSTPTPAPAKGLPWLPKVRQKELDTFLESTRMKFVGFPLQGDRESLFGLPQPIHEGVRVLKHHIYTSLAEIQVQQEEDIAKSPISVKEPPVPLTPTEILYQGLLPNLPQYMIALLKILLAAAPTSKAKTDSINIMADVLPEEMPMTVLQSLKLGTDVNRHKEIVVKAVSAILLLLLKHFKLNHIYQFEFMSQHLVFANCIPLVLKFFNQNIMAYVGSKNVIPILDFPACVIGDQPELTAESLEIGDSQPYSWRNVFSCINLLRILNKLTKWKHSRIMMLVVFKSAPILKRTLKVRHAMMQLYVLKLLKMQTKYLGRQWRKSNMKTMSAIYQKVRHRLNDDWAYGNDLDARPWDFQAEECALRASVDRFNTRRYSSNSLDPEYEPVDTNITSVLGSLNSIELTEEFKQHYDLWLQQEVFQTSINWDEILNYGYM